MFFGRFGGFSDCFVDCFEVIKRTCINFKDHMVLFWIGPLFDKKINRGANGVSGRPADTVMHHYWVKEAGDPQAIGEYFPTGEARDDGVPIYRTGAVLKPLFQVLRDHFWSILKKLT